MLIVGSVNMITSLLIVILEKSKLFFELENNGNTVSSSIPIALYSYLKNKKSRKLENILLAGFGVGLSWSGITIKI